MSGKAQSEQMFSGLPPITDIRQRDWRLGSGPIAEVTGSADPPLLARYRRDPIRPMTVEPFNCGVARDQFPVSMTVLLARQRPVCRSEPPCPLEDGKRVRPSCL